MINLITGIRVAIVIAMLILLVIQIFLAKKGETSEVLFICLIIQILNIINLALGAMCIDE